MYGQVLSSNMGLANMGSYDPFFSSPILNPPNLDFPDANIPFLHSFHQEGGVSVGQIDQEQIMQHNEQQQSIQKKPYRRHTDRQIQEMESVFKECPHPDDKLRKRLSQDLGLTPRQIRFWFQNHRTQLKARQDRAYSLILRAENQKLKVVNVRLQSIIRNLVCPNCNGPAMLKEMSDEQHLRQENACLKEELERLPSILTGSYTNRPPQMMGGARPLSPMPEPFPLWGGGEDGGSGEGEVAAGGGGPAGEDGWWQLHEGESTMLGDSPTELANNGAGKEEGAEAAAESARGRRRRR